VVLSPLIVAPLHVWSHVTGRRTRNSEIGRVGPTVRVGGAAPPQPLYTPELEPFL